jgi:hypothetical protein
MITDKQIKETYERVCAKAMEMGYCPPTFKEFLFNFTNVVYDVHGCRPQEGWPVFRK